MDEHCRQTYCFKGPFGLVIWPQPIRFPITLGRGSIVSSSFGMVQQLGASWGPPAAGVVGAGGWRELLLYLEYRARRLSRCGAMARIRFVSTCSVRDAWFMRRMHQQPMWQFVTFPKLCGVTQTKELRTQKCAEPHGSLGAEQAFSWLASGLLSCYSSTP